MCFGCPRVAIISRCTTAPAAGWRGALHADGTIDNARARYRSILRRPKNEEEAHEQS